MMKSHNQYHDDHNNTGLNDKNFINYNVEMVVKKPLNEYPNIILEPQIIHHPDIMSKEYTDKQTVDYYKDLFNKYKKLYQHTIFYYKQVLSLTNYQNSSSSKNSTPINSDNIPKIKTKVYKLTPQKLKLYKQQFDRIMNLSAHKSFGTQFLNNAKKRFNEQAFAYIKLKKTNSLINNQKNISLINNFFYLNLSRVKAKFMLLLSKANKDVINLFNQYKNVNYIALPSKKVSVKNIKHKY